MQGLVLVVFLLIFFLVVVLFVVAGPMIKKKCKMEYDLEQMLIQKKQKEINHLL
jgi:hypothetical protein